MGSPIKGPPAQSESGKGGEGRGEGRHRPLTGAAEMVVSATAIILTSGKHFAWEVSIAAKLFVKNRVKIVIAKNGFKITLLIVN